MFARCAGCRCLRPSAKLTHEREKLFLEQVGRHVARQASLPKRKTRKSEVSRRNKATTVRRHPAPDGSAQRPTTIRENKLRADGAAVQMSRRHRCAQPDCRPQTAGPRPKIVDIAATIAVPTFAKRAGPEGRGLIRAEAIRVQEGFKRDRDIERELPMPACRKGHDMKRSGMNRSLAGCLGAAHLDRGRARPGRPRRTPVDSRALAYGIIGGMSAGAIMGAPYYPRYPSYGEFLSELSGAGLLRAAAWPAARLCDPSAAGLGRLWLALAQAADLPLSAQVGSPADLRTESCDSRGCTRSSKLRQNGRTHYFCVSVLPLVLSRG